VSIPTSDPIVTVVTPDNVPARIEKRTAKLNEAETEQALLDDIYRYRGRLADSIDELHTRLSPKYQIGQLKETVSQAGNDVLGILKNQGAPVDETRKKHAEGILKGGGVVGGLMALHTLRKLLKWGSTRHNMKEAVAKGMPDQKIELLGVLEETDLVREALDSTNK
jgi:sensor c-di-GMP phosphodiesterase-like protein